MENKNNWKQLYVSTKSVIAKTEKSVLIAMPYKSDLKDYKFWHSAKLLREGRKPESNQISFTDDFTFRVFKDMKNEDGSYTVVEEKELSAKELEEIFAKEDAYFRYQKSEKTAEPAEDEPYLC